MKKTVFSIWVVLLAVLFSTSAFCRPPSRWSDPSSSPPKAAQAAEEEAGPALEPVETPGGTVLAPPSSRAGAGSSSHGATTPSPRSQKPSDLPPGWESPAQVPPGAITLEELGGRPVAPPGGFPPAPEAAPAAAPSDADEIVEEGWQEAPKRPPSRWGQ